MKTILLTQGHVALVDDEDYNRLAGYKWKILWAGGRRTVYAVHDINRGGTRTRIMMHRLILNAPPDMQVDHIDGHGLNNTRSNLRLATPGENQHNYRKQIRSSTSSRFKGVYWEKQSQKWRAQIQIRGKLIRLGFFTDEVAAAQAYNHAALEYHGRFARLNEVTTCNKPH